MQTLRIRQERINKGWTLGHVADYVGITCQSVSAIEKGLTKPSYEVLCKLGQLFNLSHQELFAEVPINNPM